MAKPTTQPPIDWLKSWSHGRALANPQWDALTKGYFADLEKVLPDLPDHLWVASSGSSSSGLGAIKLLALSRNAFLASAEAVNKHLNVQSGEIWLNPLPRFHVGGLGISARATLSNAEVIEFGSWDVKLFAETLRQTRATLTALVPTQVYDLVESREIPSKSLRAIIVGGAAMRPGLYFEARRLGWPVLPSYGLTEAASQVATAEIATLEYQLPFGAEEIMPPLKMLSHLECRTDESSTLWLRGPSLANFCIRKVDGKPAVTELLKDGWLETQDRVKLEKNLLHPLGRVDQVKKILGELVDIAEMRYRWVDQWEYAKSQFAKVRPWPESVLIEVPDERRGYNLIAVVETPTGKDGKIANPTIAEATVWAIQHFNSQVSGFQRIARAQAIEKLPRGTLNKIMFEELRRNQILGSK